MFNNTQILPLTLSPLSLALSVFYVHTSHTHTRTHIYTVHPVPSQPESDIIGYWVVWREHKSLFDHLACCQRKHKTTQKGRGGRLWNGLEHLIYSGQICLHSVYISSKPFHFVTFLSCSPHPTTAACRGKWSLSILNANRCFRWDAVKFNFTHF